MKTLAILSRKGGTGKTTLAVHLAVAAEQAGHTATIIDLDPQASATKWGDTRDADSPVVISAHSSRLPDILHTAEQSGATLAILDTAPHTESAALDAARSASFALIPCKPAILDLQSVGSTVQITNFASVASSVIFNAVPARTSMLLQARRAVEIYDTDCAPCTLGQRILFSHVFIDGKTVQELDPNSKASDEIRALYKYVANRMEI